MGVEESTKPIFDTFKILIWDLAVKSALASLFASVPFLAWPPLAALITAGLTQFTDSLYVVIKIFIVVELIVFKNKELQSKYAAASIELQDIAHQDGIESDQFKKARDENKKVLEPFVRYDRARAS